MPGARAFTFVGVASAAAALRSAGAATRIAGAKPTVAERQWRAMTELYLSPASSRLATWPVFRRV